MKIPVNWLNEFLQPACEDIDFLSDSLTMTGTKVEAVMSLGEGLFNIVTGKITDMKEHENSDKLWVCKVDVGNQKLNLVTGADNVKTGDIIPVALNGAVLPGGLEITTSMLRGVLSEGMMCSIKELGFDEHIFPDAPEKGVYVFPECTPIGMDVKEALDLKGIILDLEITSNRPDCLSVEGVAREAALATGLGFTVLQAEVKGTSDFSVKDLVKVEVEDADLCKRYIARAIKNVKIEPSPAWMQSFLRQAGMRPINNIVDITNYVLIELGQPMHAFDHNHLQDGIIKVRRARPGEKMTTLDGDEHKLTEDVLVIADSRDATGLAGVMGGEGSSISDQTKTIIFESANFKAQNIRMTSKNLGLRTESSARFEKGLDPVNAMRGMDRACQLVEELGCGEVSYDYIDLYEDSGAPKPIEFSSDFINSFLGAKIEKSFMTEILKKIGCLLEERNDLIYCTPPTYRMDLEMDVDLAEEIARFYGYNEIEATMLDGKSTTMGGYSPEQKKVKALHNIMQSAGFSEACTYSFLSPGIFDRLLLPADSPLRNTVKISNPLGEDFSLMRTTMLPAMLEVARVNLSRGNKAFDIYEIAKTYHPTEDPKSLPLEKDVLAAVTYDADESYEEGDALFRLKGILMGAASHFQLKELEFIQSDVNPSFHPGRTMKVVYKGKELGLIGYLHPDLAENFDVNKKLAVMMLETDVFLTATDEAKSYRSLPKFPPVERDLALILPVDTPAGQITQSIREAGGVLLEEVELFDIYRGKQIPEGQKSMAFGLSFRSLEKTLTEEDVNPLMEAILQTLKDKYGGILR